MLTSGLLKSERPWIGCWNASQTADQGEKPIAAINDTN
jgi:hypothetical protein